MKKVLAVLLAGLLIGAFAASHAELPAVPPKSDAEKTADAQKTAAAKAKDTDLLNKAQEKAVANYRKDKGTSMDTRKKAVAESKPGLNAPNRRGADHADAISPQHEPTRQEEATAMPMPGQANDHSSTARDAKKRLGR
jgi:hypothetical protein